MDLYHGPNSTDGDDILGRADISTTVDLDTAALPNIGIHAVFLFIIAALLAIIGCKSNQRRSAKTYRPYSGHNVHWILFSILLTLHIGAIAEGVMTDLTRNPGSTQVLLYMPPTVATVTVFLAAVYYHHMECWQLPHMSWVLLLYWTSAASGQILGLSEAIDFGPNVAILRFWISLLSLATYLALIVLELNVIRCEIFESCGYERRPPHGDLKRQNVRYRHRQASLPSRMTFWWLNWLLQMGSKNDLEMPDLGALPEEHCARFHFDLFKNAFEKEKERARNKNQAPSVWRAIFRAYGGIMAWAGFLKFIADTMGFISPLAVGGVVAYATEQYYGTTEEEYETAFVTVSEFFSNGFILVMVMFLASLIRLITLQYHYYIVVREGVHIQTALQSFVYEKSLHLSNVALSSDQLTMGQITNHMSTDSITVTHFVRIVNYMWSIPYELTMTLILLYTKIGSAALIGASVILVTIPLQFVVGGMMTKVQKETFKYSDDRLKKTTELLQSIKLLKLYGWEDVFCSNIRTSRRKEVKRIVKNGTLMIIMRSVIRSTPILMTLASFSLYYTVNDVPLTPEIAFSSVAFFNQLNIPLFMTPVMVGALVGAMVSVKRLKNFFAAVEIATRSDGRPDYVWGSGSDYEEDNGEDGKDVSSVCEEKPHNRDGKVTDAHGQYSKLKSKDDLLDVDVKGKHAGPESEMQLDTVPSCLPDEVAIKIVDGDFSWEIGGNKPTIRDVNVTIPRGKLTMITGIIGSGKSSLISAILGEITTLSGTVQFNSKHSSISYGPQKPWLQNATIRENITFGKPFDVKKYQAILQACALQPDIDILPAGDMTEIGEKGINLSGGQKQRISVARAIYSDSDIVILDDPLSALDVHVGSQLFQEGITNLLVGSNRTVVMVTHKLHVLRFAHKVLVAEGGRITRQGTLDEIRSVDPELVARWEEMTQTSDVGESRDEVGNCGEENEAERVKQYSSRESLVKREEDQTKGRLIESEERERGSVSWRVYLAYAKAVRIPAVVLIVTLIAVSVGLLALTNLWLSRWSESGANVGNSTEEEIENDVTYYVSGYAILSVACICFDFLAMSVNTVFSLLAAKRIHNSLLRNVSRAPMRFFDATPVGRILNRFSSDVLVNDQKIWQTLYMVMRTSTLILTAIIINTIVVPPFIALVFPVAVGYYFIQAYFIRSSRELQRLSSITRSPIFSHFCETLGGLTTVRAYRDERRFRQKIARAMNSHNTATLYLETANRWLGVRLDFVGALVMLISGIGCMVSSVVGRLEPSLVGLSLAYALHMCEYLNWLIRDSTETEMNMNSVERIEHYRNIPNERYEGLTNPPTTWPGTGDIKIEQLSARYDAELDPVLHNVTIHFKKGEKIGICGRTGSGKSSLVLSLFRMIDTYAGRILIDGIDISGIPLTTLRKRLTIIPQDPVLFAGSIRFNLDPCGDISDEKLWEALEIAQLKPVVMELPDKLDAQVSTGGENFSLGQRQLFCLARAVLRNTRIIVMDEATASIDLETDAILQDVVATAFADRTFVTIAHRMESILDSDSVLVLSQGKVVEYNTPENLLKNEDSVFASLVGGTK